MSRTAEKYRRDRTFRELHKKRTRTVYWRKRTIVERPPLSVFKTDSYANVRIENPADVRHGSEIRVPVYRIGQFGALFRRGPQTIRNMIKSGRLPAPLFAVDEGQRLGRGFTYDQMRVTWEYLPLLNFPDGRDQAPSRPNPERYEKGRHDPEFKRAQRTWEAAMRDHRYDHNVFSRALKEAWERMPDGVIVLEAEAEEPPR